MTNNVYARWAVDSINDYRALLDRGSPQFSQWTRVYPPLLRPRFLVPIRDQAWTTLADLARAESAARRADLDEMVRHRNMINQMLQRRDEGAVLLGANSAARTALKGMTTKLGDLAEQLTGLAQNHLSCHMAATLAMAVARFNRLDPSQGAPNTTDAGQIDKQLQTARKAVYSALQAGNLMTVRARATDLAATAGSLLFDRTLLAAAALSARRKAGVGDFTADGRLALRYAGLIRQELRDLALGRYLAWVAYWHGDVEAIGCWTEAAQTLPLTLSYKAPPAVAIATLAADPAAMSGQLVTVEGALGPVTIVHRGRKAISSAPVADKKGRTITITIPYIKLDSGGMTPGAYVRITGLWQQSSKEVAGPALLIDRLNMGELGRRSWNDWTIGRLASVFQASPHNLAAEWSWEIGANGAGNQLRYGTWFVQRRTR